MTVCIFSFPFWIQTTPPCCYGELFLLTQTQNCTSLSAFSWSLCVVFKCSRASLSRTVLWIMNIFSYVSVVTVAAKTCLEICWKKNVNVPFWARLTCFSSSSFFSLPVKYFEYWEFRRSESFLIWRPRCPLRPRTEKKLLKFEKSASLAERVISSRKEEHLNPLFAQILILFFNIR